MAFDQTGSLLEQVSMFVVNFLLSIFSLEKYFQKSLNSGNIQSRICSGHGQQQTAECVCKRPNKTSSCYEQFMWQTLGSGEGQQCRLMITMSSVQLFCFQIIMSASKSVHQRKQSTNQSAAPWCKTQGCNAQPQARGAYSMLSGGPGRGSLMDPGGPQVEPSGDDSAAEQSECRKILFSALITCALYFNVNKGKNQVAAKNFHRFPMPWVKDAWSGAGQWRRKVTHPPPLFEPTCAYALLYNQAITIMESDVHLINDKMYVYTHKQKNSKMESCTSIGGECRQVKFIVCFILPMLLVTICHVTLTLRCRRARGNRFAFLLLLSVDSN